MTEFTLTNHPFLTGLDSAHAATLAGLVVPLTFPAGSWIARAGTPADHFHLLLTGRAGIDVVQTCHCPVPGRLWEVAA